MTSMEVVYYSRLLFLYLALPFVSGTKEFSVHVCTRRSVSSNQPGLGILRITCTEGLIYIQKAVYGQSKAKICQYSKTDTCLKNALYAQPLVDCLGKTRCTMPAAPVRLERCNQDSDYLQVDYQCITGSRFDICGYNRLQSEQADGGGDPSQAKVPLVPVGHIMTSNFPADYPSALQCECMVTAAISTNTRIEFELMDFHLEESPGCPYDYTEVLEGRAETGAAEDRLCGGVQRRTRKTIESTWAKVRFRSNSYKQYRGFWIKVWAAAGEKTQVPVTIVCQRQIHHPYTVSPPVDQQGHYANPVMPPSGEETSQKRNEWHGTIPPDSAAVGSASENVAKEMSVSRNTGIIIGVCVSGLFAMVIINVVGFIICRNNMNKHGKQAPNSTGPSTHSSDSFSSLETEYVSLNSNGASYHSGLCDSNLYTTHMKSKSGLRLTGSIPNYEHPGVVVERTPGVEHSVTASDYDYGMLPETYTRKSHIGQHSSGPYVLNNVSEGMDSTGHESCGRYSSIGKEMDDKVEVEEDPYAVLRYPQRSVSSGDPEAPEGTYATIGRRHSVRHTTYKESADYDEIDDYPEQPPPAEMVAIHGANPSSHISETENGVGAIVPQGSQQQNYWQHHQQHHQQQQQQQEHRQQPHVTKHDIPLVHNPHIKDVARGNSFNQRDSFRRKGRGSQSSHTDFPIGNNSRGCVDSVVHSNHTARGHAPQPPRQADRLRVIDVSERLDSYAASEASSTSEYL